MTKVVRLSALVAQRPEHTPEAEPVAVHATGDRARLVLDGGEVIDFDRVELLAALGARAAA